MSPTRIFSTLGFFFILFVIQESAISLIHFPISGFSFYLAVAISLIAFEDHNAPFGQWALILTVIGYIFAANRDSISDLTDSPIAFVIFVGAGVTIALGMYLLFGSLLGEQNGSLSNDGVIVGGNLLWTIIFTPMFLPLLSRAREYSLTSRER